MSKKVLVLSTSLRQSSNSDLLAQKFTQGAREAGQMKTLLDRANPLYSADYRFRDVYLLTASAEGDSASDGAVNGLEGWITCFEKARLAGVVRGGGANEPGDMARLTEKLTEAYEMGRHV